MMSYGTCEPGEKKKRADGQAYPRWRTDGERRNGGISGIDHRNDLESIRGLYQFPCRCSRGFWNPATGMIPLWWCHTAHD
ncbi:hypothetical protein NHX12_021255 [Muraenolepis orangiensis]|uniref:Uncharacterized protein n=1 Tax=Muraenolepis orangiensis TaxID=630683 RepID=A0A9Q0EQ40_9TELE|nr:hypothetical protein NHX12_021255 [Muraenolepis orangiensis]